LGSTLLLPSTNLNYCFFCSIQQEEEEEEEEEE
jgi:hypothetical protein